MGKTKYIYNEKCFNDLTNQNVLYWLGFLFADGCIHKRRYSESYVVTLSLSQKDTEILNKFQKFLNTNQPVHFYKNNFSGIAEIKIHNQIINNKLLSLGLVERKSLINIFPDFLKNNNLSSHFIRGYFDGDGCISEKKHKYKTWLHFSIVGTLDFVENINKIFKEKLNIKPRKIIKQGNVYSLHIGKIDYIKKVKDFLYNDSITFLKRKKDVFFNHTEFKNGTSSKYKNICFRKKTNRWRVLFYENEKRKEKGFKTEIEAINFLNNNYVNRIF